MPCLLVVEDETAVRNLIVAFLKAGGHTNVLGAGNAEEGLFYIMRDPGLDIQLAVVDLVLPNASGLALIRKVRNAKSPRRKRLPHRRAHRPDRHEYLPGGGAAFRHISSNRSRRRCCWKR